MSVHAAAAPTGPTARGAPVERASVRLVVLFALGAFAALGYAQLLADPPVGRLFACVAVVTAGCGVLTLRVRDRLLLGAAPPRLLALALTLAGAMLVLGVPAQLLAPAAWPRLVHHVRHGVSGLGDWLWPYRGADGWTRTAVLLVVPAVLVLAGGIGLWPSRARSAGRRAAALALLLGLYLLGAANSASTGGLPALQGLVMLALIAAWTWLPAMLARDAGRAGRWLGVCCAAALLAQPLLASSEPWIGYRESGFSSMTGAAFQWDQLYGPMPWSRSSATMLEVGETRPALLRATSLDRFDGIRFLRSIAPSASIEADLGGRGGFHAGWLTTATVRVSGLRSSLLIDAGGVETRTRWLAPAQPKLVREADGTITAAAALPAGAVYTITSYSPRPEPAVLRRAPRSYPPGYLPYAQFELPGPGASGLAAPALAGAAARPPRAAQLIGPSRPGAAPGADPAVAARIASSPYAPMFALARRLAAGAASSYDVARRVEAFLRAGYGYDEHVGPARYPLEAFLFEQRRGYCQQFSGAMTLLLRMDGIPARVAAGFRPVLYDPVQGRWRIRALDAHSWVEVFFSGIGWVAFDPTPQPPAEIAGASPALSKGSLLAATQSPAVPLRRGHGVRGARTSAAGAAATAGRLAGPVLRALALSALALLAGAWLLARRRLARMLSGDGAAAAEELIRALRTLRREAPGLTLAGLERQLEGDGRLLAAGYVRALREQRYGAPRAARPDARGRAELRRALVRRGRPRDRALALLALPPGCTGGAWTRARP